MAETLALMAGSSGPGQGGPSMKEAFAFPTNLWRLGRDAGVLGEACWRTGV